MWFSESPIRLDPSRTSRDDPNRCLFLFGWLRPTKRHLFEFKHTTQIGIQHILKER